MDTPTGLKIGEAKAASSGVSIPVKVPADNKLHKVVFIFKNPEAGNKQLFSLDSIQFNSALQ